MYRKSDITFRRTGNGEGFATVNIKVPWEPLDQTIREVVEEWGEGVPATMTEEWVYNNVSKDTLADYFQMACESEYEYWAAWMGEEEDSIMRKVERIAHAIARGVNGQVVMMVYLNHYAPDNVFVDAVPVEEALAGMA